MHAIKRFTKVKRKHHLHNDINFKSLTDKKKHDFLKIQI